ncbi:alanine/ornithine racemase family PLP-dependent enzyme [Mycoplasmatota bacterium]|nr:alanine/ornithine racemase family PLP-dependent enzyme [Mycoplasmatota bacterium]
MYPQIKINLDKLAHNTKTMVNICRANGITSIFGVTKVLAGDIKVLDTVISSGITHIADSRIENLKLLQHYQLPKVLLRLPMKSEVEAVVKYTDISLNSELEIIKLLDKEANKKNKIHQIILMFDLGDLREGIWFEDNYLELVKSILNLKNIQIIGIGTNLTCYGAVIPTEENLSTLVKIKNDIENQFQIKLDIISGGNSSSLHLIFKNKLPKGINNLRIGEAIFLGRETAYEENIKPCFQDVFTLKAEIIELKEKPSFPIGERGVDAFGEQVQYEDVGLMKRAILAIGKQDIYPSNIRPIDDKINFLGASSDHLLVDVTKGNYKIGESISFRVNYGGLLQLMTSPYVNKVYVKKHE